MKTIKQQIIELQRQTKAIRKAKNEMIASFTQADKEPSRADKPGREEQQ